LVTSTSPCSSTTLPCANIYRLVSPPAFALLPDILRLVLCASFSARLLLVVLASRFSARPRSTTPYSRCALHCSFQARAIRERLFGTVHSATASTYRAIGMVFLGQGRTEEALESVPLRVCPHPPSPSSTLPECVGTRNIGKDSVVAPFFWRVLSMVHALFSLLTRLMPCPSSQQPPPRDLTVSTLLLPRCARAFRFFQRALDALEALHGPDHEDVRAPFVHSLYRDSRAGCSHDPYSRWFLLFCFSSISPLHRCVTCAAALPICYAHARTSAPALMTTMASSRHATHFYLVLCVQGHLPPLHP